jgi:Zn-dependent peptidase ImmA (M78 family)|tara:strand:+ start:5566 stop:5886 length:321 start_codon:yes stop_codon:yes gene_type:complete
MSEPKPPRKVKILNFTYKVKFVEATERDAAEADGWCDYDNQIIVICKSMSNQAIADTFLHECIHALNHSVGINFRKDEDIARKVGTGICTLFKDNKAAMRWWISLL